MHTVPFKIPSLFADLAEAKGIMSLEGKELTLELQTVDSVLGLLKSDVQEIVVPVDALAEAGFAAKFFSRKVVLRGRKMSTLAEVPGCEAGIVKLTIAKKDSEAAQNLVADLALLIAEYKLDTLK